MHDIDSDADPCHHLLLQRSYGPADCCYVYVPESVILGKKYDGSFVCHSA